jgi:hypothetical protein
MADNDKNIEPGCCVLWFYIKSYFRLKAAFPDLLRNGGILFKNIYLTTGGKNEVRSKKYEIRDIVKDTFFQEKFFTKIAIRVEEARRKVQGARLKDGKVEG